MAPKKSMENKRKNTALITAAIAAVLALILLIAGTMLRMRTHDLNFAQAFCSFVSDTFRFGAR